MAGLAQRPGHSANVATPMMLRWARVIEAELHRFTHLLRVNSQDCVAPRAPGGVTETIDGKGKHESFVVIHVLADEVDAAGCAKDSRSCAKQLDKALAQILEGNHRQLGNTCG